ncbi:MAG: DEAD/DEAH box helicase [Deltaproteobacteria bacterium]|nr:DEAD/DEAH box helicase [Deltaproteobacteria bacterium]
MTDRKTFAQLGLSDKILHNLKNIGYDYPSPIQESVIPSLMENRNLIGLAQTGTGKTAAYALPIIEKIEFGLKKPQALVIAPTRELAMQITKSFKTYSGSYPLRVLSVYGGQSYDVQLRHLSDGVHVIVGTPGRVMDHMRRKTLETANIRTLVLDEADEMLRMGFIEDIEWIMDQIPGVDQTMLFSATMPERIRRISEKFLSDPVEVNLSVEENVSDNIVQHFWKVSRTGRIEAVARFVETEENIDGVIIFVRTRSMTLELAEKLGAGGFSVDALNGDMTQLMRERVVSRFKDGRTNILVATDIAARGLDVPRITHVINFDVPDEIDTYIHRIGRTGRYGRIGKSIIFLLPSQNRLLYLLRKHTGQDITEITLPTAYEITQRRIALFKKEILNSLEKSEIDFFHKIVEEIKEESDISIDDIAAGLAYMAQKTFPVHHRKILASPEELRITDRGNSRSDRRDKRKNHFSEKSDDNNKIDSNIRNELNESSGDDVRKRNDDTMMVGVKISAGKNHGVEVRDIVGAFINEGGVRKSSIGRISIFSDWSVIDVHEDSLPTLFETMKKSRIRGVAIKPAIAKEKDSLPEKSSFRSKKHSGERGISKGNRKARVTGRRHEKGSTGKNFRGKK